MRDPDSVQVSGLEAAEYENGSYIVCGFYNAKNGFGGYAGRTPFFAFFASFADDEPMIGWEPEGALLVRARCAASGLLQGS